MVLASQQGRPALGRRYVATTSRRRTRSARPILIIAVLAVLCGITVAVARPWNWGGSSDPVATTPPPSPPPPEQERQVANNEPPDRGGTRTPTTGDRTAAGDRGSSTDERPSGSDRNTTETSSTRPGNTSLEARSGQTSAQVRSLIREGSQALEAGELVKARRILSRVLRREGRGLADEDARAIRNALREVNAQLLWSRTVAPDDPLVEHYRIAPGDNLQSIARRYKITPELLARINELPDPNRIRAGQNLKVIHGPFNLEVIKPRFRTDLLIDDPETGEPLYVASFAVGLGREDRTPPGRWVVSQKQVDPDWRDPDTNRYYRPGPENPIGSRWIRLRGLDPSNESLTGYGIHGTIDPSSIGRQESRGCVRLRNDHVEYLFDYLSVGNSKVLILEGR
ncbi:MAG: L,D-transpeptidase family protein [Phycisphaeraceae bacterium]|nr:L,D-transpeptidase family protein [Phycisphaeraceae bacterium]